MKRKINTAIIVAATIFSDWSALLLPLYLSFVFINGTFKLKKRELFPFVSLILIAIIYSYLGFMKTETIFVIKNSLIFWLLPTIFLIKNYQVSLRVINLLIRILYTQCLIVIALHLLGVDVYNREGMFSFMLGYYSGGGTVVLFRFYSYKLVLLMSLIIIRFTYFKYSPERSFLNLLVSVLISGSKALSLSLVSSLVALIRKTNGMRKIILLTVVLFVMLGASVFYPIVPLILAAFDPSDVSNETRLSVYQTLLLDPVSLMIGNGFGHPLPSSLIRDPARPYGYEISYISYMHKIGLFLFYVAWVLARKLDLKGLLALMPVWLAALGNPTLSHLYNLFLFSIIIGSRK